MSDWDMKVSRTRMFKHALLDKPEHLWWWERGTVVTRWGIVGVEQVAGPKDNQTRYEFVHGGRLHTRSEEVLRSDRSMQIMAGRLARDIARAKVRKS